MSTKNHELLCSKLSLRQLDPVADIDDFMLWASDDQVTQFCSWESYKSKEQAIEYINNNVVNHKYFKAICVDNKAIGAISVALNEGNDKCRGELGYVLARRHWGKGIATWAVKAVVSTIFEERLELERVEALVDADNVGSQKVLEKAGFVKECVLRKYLILKGRTRDMVMFSILRIDRL